MKIRFWGVRGSIPAPGPDTIRYGGNTSCVSVHTASGGLIIIDMGTGLMHLGNALMTGAFGQGKGHAAILLSHTHWDHIQGLGFFPPVFIAGNQFTVYGPGNSPEVLEQILEGQMDPNFSPLQSLKNFSADFDVCSLPDGKVVEAEGVSISAREHPHGNTVALGFRITEGTGAAARTFVYASDVGYPESGPPADAITFYNHADVLLHDTTYRPEDQATRRNRGFSSYEEAADAAIRSHAKRLVMFHYDQDYSDDVVDEICTATRAVLDARGGKDIGLVPAREGDELEV